MDNNKIEKIKKLWEQENISNSIIIEENEILSFQNKNNLFIPSDLAEYFKQLNGSNDEYDKNFFRFYSFSDFTSLGGGLTTWNGSSDVINAVGDFVFVFADYLFCMFSYAIKLYSNASLNNEVLIICGDESKIIANSFSEFIDLYLDNSIELQFND